jgi:hypothetical protein
MGFLFTMSLGFLFTVTMGFQLTISNHTEYFIYPFRDEFRALMKGEEIVDLNLTEIVSAFIGGEYV